MPGTGRHHSIFPRGRTARVFFVFPQYRVVRRHFNRLSPALHFRGHEKRGQWQPLIGFPSRTCSG